MEPVNFYEQAFECWLREQKIAYESVVQIRRVETATDSIKNFDFLLWPGSDSPVLVELKGRTFHGGSLTGLKGLDSWVTFDDVEALDYWLRFYQQTCPAVGALFVFVYQIEQVDIETDGWPVYEFEGRRFVMLSVPLSDYRSCMKCRSPKWQTVMLSAADFSRLAIPVPFLNRKIANVDERSL